MQEIRVYEQKRASFVAKEIFLSVETIVATGAGKYLFPHWQVDFIGKLKKKQ